MPDQEPELWARRAASFGTSARDYADHRPDYAPEAISWCLAGAHRPVLDVLDLAAGTGALTGGLVSAGLTVTAVERDPLMLEELTRRLPDVPAVVGNAEAIPLPDASVDAVVVGTAFHWFDKDRALPEILRVLRPGGVLGLFYDLVDTSVGWAQALHDISRSSVSLPETGDPMEPPSYDGFGPVELEMFPHPHRRTADSLTATIGTHSHTTVIESEERVELLTRVRAFLAANPETADGEFDYPMDTWVGRATPLSPARK